MPQRKSKARERLQKSKETILKIFDYRCIRCGKATEVIHEIIPISHGRKALAGVNRVPLCDFPNENSCHDWAHRVGTRNSIPTLQSRRAEFLRWKWQKRLERLS